MRHLDPYQRAVAAIESTPPAYLDPRLNERLRAMSRTELEDWLVLLLAHQREVQQWLGTHDCSGAAHPKQQH